MGEFVHLGKPVVPVLVKALKLPGTRVRYNAILTLSMINDARAVPNLLERSYPFWKDNRNCTLWENLCISENL